jgi:hypothetical protein
VCVYIYNIFLKGDRERGEKDHKFQKAKPVATARGVFSGVGLPGATTTTTTDYYIYYYDDDDDDGGDNDDDKTNKY